MNWTKTQRKMFTEAIEQGDMPRALAEMPELDPELQFIYDGYMDVGRSSGMGGGSRFSEKVFWLDYHKIIADPDRDFILHCWRQMSPVDSEKSDELADRESKSKKKGSSAKSHTMGSGHVK